MIFCARATRGRGLPSLDARRGRSISPHPWRNNERVWRDYFIRTRSMRAVKIAIIRIQRRAGDQYSLSMKCQPVHESLVNCSVKYALRVMFPNSA